MHAFRFQPQSAPLVLLVAALALGGLLGQAAWAAEVRATAEAEIVGGDREAAEKAAVAKALTRAVEQAIGIYVKQEFNATQQESVKNNETKFSSLVRDELLQRTEGFVKTYTLEGKQTVTLDGRPHLRVSVLADVYKDKLTAELRRLAELIAAAGNPKLMVVIQVVETRPDGSRAPHGTPQLPGLLAKELLDLGFEVVGGSRAQALVAQEPAGFAAWIRDADQAVAVAAAEGADILIGGIMEVVNKGVIEDDMGLAALKGQVRIEIKTDITAVHVASKALLSSEPVSVVSIGIDLDRALHRAMQGKTTGKNKNLQRALADRIIEDAKRVLTKEAEQGLTFVLVLENAPKYRTHAKPFLELLQAIPQCANVRELSYDAGVLTAELSFKGQPRELEDTIFAAAEKGPAVLRQIDKKSGAGRKIVFSL